MRAAQFDWKLASLAVLLLSACGGELAYKRGAGADELSQAREQCRREGSAYDACMQSKGWKLHKLDEDNPLAVYVPGTDPRGVETVYVAADKPVNMPAGAAAAPQGAAMAKAPASTGAPEKKSPPDPMTKFNVSSWWKMGGGAGDLKASTDACVAKLGPAHAPEIEKKLYSRGLILCLKEQGWYGLQGNGY